MGKSFGPAAALMSRLKYPQRFALITLVFLIPIALLLYSFLFEIGRQSDFSQKERDGLAYLRPLMELYKHTNQERLLGIAAAHGIATSGPELVANQAQIELDFEALMAADAKYGASLKTTDQATSLKSSWEVIKSNPADPARAEKLDKLAADTGNLMTLVGDTSNIILDLDLDTYYMQDMLLRLLPEARDRLVEAVVLGDRAITAKAVGPEERARISLAAGLLKSGASDTRNGANTAFNNNPIGNLRPQVETRLNAYLAAIDSFAATAEAELVRIPSGTDAPALTIGAETWLNAANRVLAANYDLWTGAVTPFDDLLSARINSFTQRRNITLGITSAVLLIVLYLWVGFYVVVRRTISTMERASKLMESGGKVQGSLWDGGLELSSNDELSRSAAASFSKIAAAANELNTTIDERTNELTEVAAVLAHHHDGIVIIDERGTVKVLNGAATQMLYTSFDVAVGRSLIDLTRDQKVQELLRAALLTPGQHQAIDLSINNRVVLMVAKFIQVTENQLTGLITMQDVTEVRRLQRVTQNNTMALAR